jgi:hypothetical protein
MHVDFLGKISHENLKNEANVAYYAPKFFTNTKIDLKKEEKERGAQHFICCQENKAERQAPAHQPHAQIPREDCGSES